jgi:hypothetical protein
MGTYTQTFTQTHSIVFLSDNLRSTLARSSVKTVSVRTS